MKLLKDQVVCAVCSEIIPKEESKRCVTSITWGSLSGNSNYGVCCKSHKTDAAGYLVGWAYA